MAKTIGKDGYLRNQNSDEVGGAFLVNEIFSEKVQKLILNQNIEKVKMDIKNIISVEIYKYLSKNINEPYLEKIGVEISEKNKSIIVKVKTNEL